MVISSNFILFFRNVTLKGSLTLTGASILTLDITVTKVMLLDSILPHPVSSETKCDKRSLNIAIFLLCSNYLSVHTGTSCPNNKTHHALKVAHHARQADPTVHTGTSCPNIKHANKITGHIMSKKWHIMTWHIMLDTAKLCPPQPTPPPPKKKKKKKKHASKIHTREVP